MSALSWKDVEKSLKNLIKPEGGFSAAHRGLVTLADGKQIFVKIGTDDNTKKWAKKEIGVYRFLQANKYPYMPKLLAWSDDQAGFAVEALTEGWDWSDNWTPARLAATLQAIDVLAALKPEGPYAASIDIGTFGQNDNGWVPLQASSEQQRAVLAKLRAVGRSNLAEKLNFDAEAKRSLLYAFSIDTLSHHDVRADNCAWNSAQQTVKLVDWNWAQMGDRRIDLAGLLVSVQKAGLDVIKLRPEHLHAGALHWLAGFWLNAAVTPIWPGGPTHLRDFQLQSAIIALDLAQKLNGQR